MMASPGLIRTAPMRFRRLVAASYHTNTDRMKRDDPYAALGLSWGATATEIKDAYRRKAQELHPDVNSTDSPEMALRKFQAVQRAYAKLMDVKGAPHRDDLAEEWSFAVWRNGDVIAQERTDVAGEARKRPAKPAVANTNKQWGIAALGHPDGGGTPRRRGEFLGDGREPKSSTVGTGRSKWVKPREFQPWNPDEVKVQSARQGRPKSEEAQ
eukprot:CAMPEP_0183297498 /NCGR_PEP_ID=MMETSP0160_2-20130417/4778_1 /TAXON_ID=2839 ORGANISM="Odontella Sinensis, Strain Grunow 1884" /NCGR_SAMPLE_ID=MMETSP0160_2 /ASSEMBLY_ACC=CAM_ASM_000250 /LENGTH=211 /DNA_ID=CAMNT_0025459335 /DNA_START=178 /DNA_END=813 /DNA_ORIENTATION=-